MRVAVVGACGGLGELVVGRLAESHELVAIDESPPERRPDDVEQVQLDPRSPHLCEILESERTEALCYLPGDPRPAGWRARAGVGEGLLDGMHLLSACALAGVRRVVVLSSGLVYGASAANPGFISERRRIRKGVGPEELEDVYDLEIHGEEFARDHPEVEVVYLRPCPVLGPPRRSPMARYLGMRLVPTLLGFDPLFQLLDEEDLVRAFEAALAGGPPGPCNVAPVGVLPLSKILRLARRIPVPVFHPLAYRGASVLSRLGARPVPVDLDFLRYSCVISSERMKREFGFEPRYTTEEALRRHLERAGRGAQTVA